MKNEVRFDMARNDLAVLSHDARNAMTALIGWFDLLKTAIDPKVRSKAMEMLQQTAASCGALCSAIGRLNDPAYFEYQPNNINGCDISEVFNSTLSTFAIQLPANIELYRNFRAAIWHVVLSGMSVARILNNLLINAREAMPNGGVITVHAANIIVTEEVARNFWPTGLKPGRYVCLNVIDTGDGIPPHIQKQLFNSQVTTKENGSGIGLRTVHQLITSAGGAITCESVVGTGTRFELYFPAMGLEI